jgi:hypothetical protein
MLLRPVGLPLALIPSLKPKDAVAEYLVIVERLNGRVEGINGALLITGLLDYIHYERAGIYAATLHRSRLRLANAAYTISDEMAIERIAP